MDIERLYELHRALDLLMDAEERCLAEGDSEGAELLAHAIEYLDGQI